MSLPSSTANRLTQSVLPQRRTCQWNTRERARRLSVGGSPPGHRSYHSLAGMLFARKQVRSLQISKPAAGVGATATHRLLLGNCVLF